MGAFADGPLRQPIAVLLAVAFLVYMSLGAFVALRAAIRVSGDVWKRRIVRSPGVLLASAAWAIGLGAAHLVAQLWADGLALLVTAAG
jgi:protein-S-isoprenylcysteine O-methyltransferase Ste14